MLICSPTLPRAGSKIRHALPLLQDIPEWHSRLKESRGLPPPWETHAGSSSLARQEASACPWHQAPSHGSKGPRLPRLLAPSWQLPEEQLQHREQRTPGNSCSAAKSKLPFKWAGSAWGINSRVHPEGECSSSCEQLSHDPSSQLSRFPLSAPEQDMSFAPNSQKPGSSLRRLQIICRHTSPPGKPCSASPHLYQQGQQLTQTSHCLAVAQGQCSSAARASCCGPSMPSAAGIRAGLDGQPGRGLAAAVSAAEPSVVALMAPDGSWASGIVVSARHGFILTVAHLLREQSYPPAQQSRPVSVQCSAPSCRGAPLESQQPVQQQERPVSMPAGAMSTSDSLAPLKRVIEPQGCSPAHTPQQQRRKGSVLVHIHSIGPGNGDSSKSSFIAGHGGRKPFWASATLVYCFEGPLDMAVVQLDDIALRETLTEFELSSEENGAASQGQRVAMMGFPLLSPRLGFGPCVTAGIIAKVILITVSL